MNKYDKVVLTYEGVKDGIKYAFPARWGGPEQTMKRGTGHCGMKCEVLAGLLKAQGFKVRYVEGRKTGWYPTWVSRILAVLGLCMFDAHIWVEVLIDDDNWLTLDSAPDSGIVHCLGNTWPGYHLGTPEQIDRWDEIPAWYKDGYNVRILSPLRFIAGLEIKIRRLIG